MSHPQRLSCGHVSSTTETDKFDAYKGQPDGKVGMNFEQDCDCEPETPPSPDAKRMEVPRVPIEAYALQSFSAKAREIVLSSYVHRL